jgi:hypothetical protein
VIITFNHLSPDQVLLHPVGLRDQRAGERCSSRALGVECDIGRYHC